MYQLHKQTDQPLYAVLLQMNHENTNQIILP